MVIDVTSCHDSICWHWRSCETDERDVVFFGVHPVPAAAAVIVGSAFLLLTIALVALLEIARLQRSVALARVSALGRPVPFAGVEPAIVRARRVVEFVVSSRPLRAPPARQRLPRRLKVSLAGGEFDGPPRVVAGTSPPRHSAAPTTLADFRPSSDAARDPMGGRG